VGTLLPACEPRPTPPSPRFAWGVASGDPTARSVVLWTRLDVREPEEIELEVFEDPDASAPVTRELALAEPERDGCVKVDLEGLSPGSTYYFRFRTIDGMSPLGRTRTLPEGPTAHVRLGVVTCSNFAAGHFQVYRRLAERPDLWAIVHLGDSIYEYGDGEYGSLRPLDPPHTTVTLSEYRRRYARYRLDPDLAELTRQHPLLVVWDDHEFANNAHRAGAPGHDPEVLGPWADRVEAARRAFFEWTPVRDETRVHRALQLGDLTRIVLLDTRMDGRDPPPIDEAEWQRRDRRLVSDEQERWLRGWLASRDVSFTVVANQVVLAPFAAQNNLDAWDGYPAQRARILEAIAGAPAPVVVVTGDTHSSLALDLPGPTYEASTQRGSLGVEWGTSAVSSPTLASDPRETERALLASTPHLRFTEQEHRGFLLLDITHARARGEWWLLDGVARPEDGRATLVRAFETNALDRASRAASPLPSPPASDAPPRAR
jgi:alkaline phosphatase D